MGENINQSLTQNAQQALEIAEALRIDTQSDPRSHKAAAILLISDLIAKVDGTPFYKAYLMKELERNDERGIYGMDESDVPYYKWAEDHGVLTEEGRSGVFGTRAQAQGWELDRFLRQPYELLASTSLSFEEIVELLSDSANTMKTHIMDQIYFPREYY